jgi:hypothetical protein
MLLTELCTNWSLPTYIHTYIYHFGGSIVSVFLKKKKNQSDMKLVKRRETSASTNRVDTNTIW